MNPVLPTRLPTRLLALAALLAAATAGGCGGRSLRLARAASDTAYIGVAVGLQSPERYANVFTGVQTAIDELNATHPAGTPPLALRRAPANVKSHVEIAAAFRDDPAVVGVVGHTETDATISAAAVYEDREHDGEHALAAVSPTAGGRLVTRASTWVFRVCPVVEQQAKLMARYVADTLHRRRAAIVYRADAPGKEFIQAFAAEYTARGGTVAERDPFLEEIPEFGHYAQRIARRQADALVLFANTSDARNIIRAVHAAGSTPPAIGTNGPTAEELRKDTAAARDFRGMYYLALYSPDRPLTSRSTEFARAFERRGGTKPDHWAALGYDAAMLIGLAVRDVGADRRRVRDRIADVGRARAAFEGATGTIRFDQWRDPIDKAAVVSRVGEVAP